MMNDYLELMVMGALFLVGFFAHWIATYNRGSFVDIPDWNKVVRRAIELICTLIAVVLLIGLGWGRYWLATLFLIVFPTLGIVFVVIVYFSQKKKLEADIDPNAKQRSRLQQMILSLHLVNALTLALFLLSGMLVVLITLAKVHDQAGNVVFLYSLLSLLLSSELLLLAYQLCNLILVHRVPNEENIKIVKICNELND